jgi:aldehyde dehydrogenase (NAD+)
VNTERESLFLAGEWVPASEGIDVISPSTEERIGGAPFATKHDVDRAVAAARRVADERTWELLGTAGRADILDRVFEVLQPMLTEVAPLVSAEMGVPITPSRMLNIDSVSAMWPYVTELGRSFATEELRHENPDFLVLRQPVGVVAAVAPWNAPFRQAVYKMLYPLMAGCPVIFKPAPETPLSCFVLADAMAEAGVPPGVVSILPGGSDIGEHLVGHPGVDKVFFTGSSAVGRRIGAICGEQFKRTLLELGGKSAAIVFDDADLDTVVAGLTAAGFFNSGQVCTKTSRVLVSERLHDELVDALSTAAQKLIVGDPFDVDTQVGPLVAERQRRSIEEYVGLGVADGATIVTGGGRPAGLDQGWYVEPTVMTNVDNSSRIAQEEVFGPLLTVTTFKDQDEAIRLANDSTYGLSGAVYTTSPERARAVVAAVRTGAMGINGSSMNHIAPMGGVKSSGIGRKGGPEGLASFFELKSVHNPGLIV